MSLTSLAIHGGAGLIRRDSLSSAREDACMASLRSIVEAVHSQLQGGASALDAVEEAVIRLEDDPLFNAGRGAVYTSDETIEFDASIMDGSTRSLGAIGSARFVRNPIKLARAVMEKTPHAMMSGLGAEELAKRLGLPMEDLAYFHVPERLEQLRRARKTGAFTLDHDDDRDDVYGTVGAVALDRDGNVACATSTGGMVNKLPGRVGDTPMMGSGFFASNATCAVSATGHGEAIIRSMTSGRVAQRMEFTGAGLVAAARAAIAEDLAAEGGLGGIIAVDVHGNIAMPYNTAGMFRGAVGSTHPLTVSIWS
jgi:beta-aspartyl-peptidase (threonine type)